MSERLELVEARRLRGFSQEYMAEKLGIHRNTYASIEKIQRNVLLSLQKRYAQY